MLLKHDPDDLKPCSHMQTLVSAWADGKLTGLLQWYTEWHLAHCPRCTAAIPVLRALRARLRRLSQRSSNDDMLTPERRAAVEVAWERMDHVAAGPPGA